MDKGIEKISKHFHFNCPAFAILMLKHLGKYTFGELEDLAETDMRQVKLNFWYAQIVLLNYEGLIIIREF